MRTTGLSPVWRNDVFTTLRPAVLFSRMPMPPPSAARIATLPLPRRSRRSGPARQGKPAFRYGHPHPCDAVERIRRQEPPPPDRIVIDQGDPSCSRAGTGCACCGASANGLRLPRPPSCVGRIRFAARITASGGGAACARCPASSTKHSPASPQKKLPKELFLRDQAVHGSVFPDRADSSPTRASCPRSLCSAAGPAGPAR